MTKASNVYRSPTSTINSTTSYSSQHTYKKAVKRLLHDGLLTCRNLNLLQFPLYIILFVSIFILLSIYAFSSKSTTLQYATLRIKPSTCACPPPSISHVFSDSIISTAAFVAKVTHLNTYSQNSLFQIQQLYRGPPRSTQFPILVPHEYTSACISYQNSLPSSTSSNISWLLVGGPLVHSNLSEQIPVEYSQQYNNFSILSVTRLLAPGCSKSNSDYNIKSSINTIWLTPWSFLSPDVIQNIVQNSEDDSSWWRLKYPWIDFSEAIHHTNIISHDILKRHRIQGTNQYQREEWWISDGISIVAACKDRSQTLQKALQSWLSLQVVKEIVLVDWSSKISIQSQLPSNLLNDSRVVFVNVQNQQEWILSRAYNLAVRFTSYSKVMKVDCDTYLAKDFFEVHHLEKDIFFAGDWRQLHSGVDEELHANGLLYVHRDDFLAVGGYDERIMTYGWDDSDIVERIAKVRTPKRIIYSKVQHIPHPAALRVINQHRESLLSPDNPYAASVEIQRNRLLMTKCNLSPWRAGLARTTWNVQLVSSNESNRKTKNHLVFSVTAANYLTPASALVSDADSVDVAKRAIRLILHRYGVQFLPKSVSLEFYKKLVEKVAFPNRYAEVLLRFRGGCVSRLLAHVASKYTTSDSVNVVHLPTGSYIGWRLQGLWQFPDTECTCKFLQVIRSTEEEIISSWFDTSNPLPQYLPISEKLANTDVLSVLSRFDESAQSKNISENVRWWKNDSDSQGNYITSRMLIRDLACDAPPKTRDEAWQNAIRAQLRHLDPTHTIAEVVGESLSRKDRSKLDSILLAKPESFVDLLGSSFGQHVNEILKSSNLRAMAVKWSGQQLALEPQNFHLENRAAALSTAIHLADKVKVDRQFDETRFTNELLVTLKYFSSATDKLFAGCPAPTSHYLRAYPELTIIIASLLTCRTCT